MKDYIKAGLFTGLCAGAVYLTGAYFGYRAGKAKGHLDEYIEQLGKLVDEELDELKQKYPECFVEES